MEASWKLAAVAGMFGLRVARDATYNGLVNDQVKFLFRGTTTYIKLYTD